MYDDCIVKEDETENASEKSLNELLTFLKYVTSDVISIKSVRSDLMDLKEFIKE
jgi:hypothetical protein